MCCWEWTWGTQQMSSQVKEWLKSMAERFHAHTSSQQGYTRLLQLTPITSRETQEIEVYIESCPCEIDTPTEFLLEPSNNFIECYSMMMACSLVDVSTSATGIVRLMNPFDQEAVIQQNSVLGQAKLLDEETEVMSYVSTGEPEGPLGEPQGKPKEGTCTLAGDVVHNLSGTETMDTQIIDNTDEHKSGEDKDQQTSITVQRISSANYSILEHLRHVFKTVVGKTSEDKQVTIKSFAGDATDLGHTHFTVHERPTRDAPPVKQKPSHVPMALVHEEREAIGNLKRQGVIRESNSLWAPPIVLGEKNGKIRQCVDIRTMNSLTRKDAYPIPRTQDCLCAMGGSVLFSALDMTTGYHQIPIQRKEIYPK